MYETLTVWPIRCFFDYHVVSFALTHSKTHQSDVIWCRQHGRRDHSSISTLMTTLLRKQWIITISPFVSDCTIGYNLSVLIIPGSNLVGRYSLTHYTSLQKIISINFILNKISLSVYSMYGTITFWPIRCFSTIMSLLLHQHIRKHASRM